MKYLTHPRTLWVIAIASVAAIVASLCAMFPSTIGYWLVILGGVGALLGGALAFLVWREDKRFGYVDNEELRRFIAVPAYSLLLAAIGAVLLAVAS